MFSIFFPGRPCRENVLCAFTPYSVGNYVTFLVLVAGWKSCFQMYIEWLGPGYIQKSCLSRPPRWIEFNLAVIGFPAGFDK